MKDTILNITTLILFAGTIFLFSSCDKITRDLGKETSSGENTMGFYIDGEAVKIKGKYERGGVLGESHGVKAGIVDNETIYIFGVKASAYSIKFNVPIDSLSSTGEYRLRRAWSGTDEASITDKGSSLGGNHYFTSKEHDGIIRFTRYDDKVISGTFHFDAINTETDKVISVTRGRFDISRQ